MSNVQPDPRYAGVAGTGGSNPSDEPAHDDPSDEHTNTRTSDEGVESKPRPEPRGSARVDAAPTEAQSLFPRAG